MIYIAILTSIIIPTLTILKKTLTIAAAVFAGLLILFSFVFGGYYCGFLLLFSYAIIVIVDKINKSSISDIAENINKKTGARDLVQVIANGLPALVSVILFYFTKNNVFVFCYSVGITESLCDSVASDIGILSKSTPVNICTFKPIQKGMSGGISFLGTVSSFLASLIGGTLFYIVYNNCLYALLIVIVSFFGCIIDSFLGATVQLKNICIVCNKLTEKDVHCGTKTSYYRGIKIINNCAVNFISNLISVILMYIICF
ncbi:MAG: DUF92 domain-containing protein [Clostridia bacterium]|nr:DUF92 domain-containing protein [Clostridia bacterium]